MFDGKRQRPRPKAAAGVDLKSHESGWEQANYFAFTS